MSAQSAIEELIALWSATFGGPPAVKASAQELARILVNNLEPAPPYEPMHFAPRQGGDGCHPLAAKSRISPGEIVRSPPQVGEASLSVVMSMT